LREKSRQWWACKDLAKRLYIGHGECHIILRDLQMSGFLIVSQSDFGQLYRYLPSTDMLRERVDRLTEAHASNLRDITDLIHLNASRYQRWWARLYTSDERARK
jgi:hypothetical protein